MLASTQSSLEAMQRLYAAAQNQLFELQSNKEAAVVVKQVRTAGTAGWEGNRKRAAVRRLKFDVTTTHGGAVSLP